MSESLPRVMIRNPDLVSADMDGETVMMSIANGAYFGIGGIGASVWQMLETPQDLDTMVAVIMAEYDVEDATCRADLRGFLADLLRNDLIQPV